MSDTNFHYNQSTRYECDVISCRKHGICVPDKNGNCPRCEKQRWLGAANVIKQFNRN